MAHKPKTQISISLINDLLHEHNHTQKDLCTALEISVATLGLWGQNGVTKVQLTALAVALLTLTEPDPGVYGRLVAFTNQVTL